MLKFEHIRISIFPFSAPLIFVAVLCVSLVPSSAEAVPAIGLYFDGDLVCEDRLEAEEIFYADLCISGTDKYISAVEYCLGDLPGSIVLLDVEYPPQMAVMLGDPLTGHSIAFSPPLQSSSEPVLVCRLKFIALESCEQMGPDLTISVVPHPDSGLLGFTEPPDHEIFELQGLASILCPGHWPPELSDVTVYAPRCVKASFNQYVYNWGMGYDEIFTLYTTAEPHDTIQIIEAIKSQPSGGHEERFFVYFESAMTAGTGYTLAASACAECNGCADSEFDFVYQGGFESLPDLAPTFWIDADNGSTGSFPHDCSPAGFGWTMRNLGEAASGPFSSRIVAETLSGDSTAILWEGGCEGLAVDEAYPGDFSAMIPNLDSHLNLLRLEIDYQGEVPEASEQNNILETRYGNFKPRIISIADVPDDEGGWVEMILRASFYDIEYYGRGWSVGDYSIHRLNRSDNSWESVLEFPASGDSLYSRILPTVVDSAGESGDYWTVFRVYYTGYGTYSCPDSGYSVDNSGPTAVLLQDSGVRISGRSVILSWSIAENSECSAFGIYRSRAEGDYTHIKTLKAGGSEASFEYRDCSIKPGSSYTYRVEYIDSRGSHLLFESGGISIPGLEFALEQNVPNPFNPSTKITFTIPEDCFTVLDVFDVSGRRVTRLMEGVKKEGEYTVDWNGIDGAGNPVASGIFFYRLTAGRFTAKRRMVLLR